MARMIGAREGEEMRRTSLLGTSRSAHAGKNGLRAVGLLCSPNARPEKGLVQARNWRPISPHSPNRASKLSRPFRGCSLRWRSRSDMRAVRKRHNKRAGKEHFNGAPRLSTARRWEIVKTIGGRVGKNVRVRLEVRKPVFSLLTENEVSSLRSPHGEHSMVHPSLLACLLGVT